MTPTRAMLIIVVATLLVMVLLVGPVAVHAVGTLQHAGGAL